MLSDITNDISFLWWKTEWRGSGDQMCSNYCSSQEGWSCTVCLKMLVPGDSHTQWMTKSPDDRYPLSLICVLRLAGYMKSCFLLVTCESLRKMCGEKLANDLRDVWEVGGGRAKKRTQRCMKSRTRSFTSAQTENGECICHFSLALTKQHNPDQSNLWKKGLVWIMVSQS